LPNVWTGSWLSANSWNNMIENINYLKQNQSDCIWASIWASCGGWKYAGWGIVATTGDSTSAAWTTAFTSCINNTSWWFKDWRLPNSEELRLLYNYRATIWGFATSWYWSSTEYDATYVRGINFNGGNLNYDGKPAVFAVRCVRKF